MPVHHRVPVLRHAPAQARAEAREGRRPEAPRAGASGRSSAACGRARSPASAPTGGRTRRSSLVLASVLVTLFFQVRARQRHQLPRRRAWPRARSTATTGSSSRSCSSTGPRPATRSPRSPRSSCSAGCWSAATARGRRCSCSSSAAWPGRRLVLALDPHGGTVGANSRGAGAARRRGRCATCWRAGAARRTTPTCSACSRSPSCSCCCRWSHRGRARWPGWPAASSGSCSGCCLARLPAALARTRIVPGSPATSRPTAQPSIAAPGRPRRAGRRRSSRRTAASAAARAPRRPRW